MKIVFTLLIAAKLVRGEPIVFLQASSRPVDFGRQIYAKDMKHHGFLSDKIGKLSHKLDQSKLRHTPKIAAFQSAAKTGLLDFDNPLEDIFTSRFHLKNTVRHLGKASKSKSSKKYTTEWHDGTSSKSKSKSSVWNGWHAPLDEHSKSKKTVWHAPGHDKNKSSKSKSSKSKSSAWTVWHAPGHGKSSKSKSSKSKSSVWSGYHVSAGGGGGGGASYSAGKSSKGHGYKASSTSFDFSYQIGISNSWSFDESRETTPPELLTPPIPVKAVTTASPVHAKPAAPELVHVEPKPREDTTMLVSVSLETNPMNTDDVSGANEQAVVYEGLRSNKMYYIAGAALIGGLVTFFAAVFIKRNVRPNDTHMELKEDDTDVTTPSDGSHSYNLGTIQHSTTPDNDCGWSHADSWLASDMRA